MVVIFYLFQSSPPLFINLSNSLVIVLHLMLPLCGILSLMRFVPLHPWHPSENSLKPTCTPKHTHPSLDHSPGVRPPSLDHSPGVRTVLCPWIQNFVDCFLFCCALESSCLGRLSAIKVHLELELNHEIYDMTQ